MNSWFRVDEIHVFTQNELVSPITLVDILQLPKLCLAMTKLLGIGCCCNMMKLSTVFLLFSLGTHNDIRSNIHFQTTNERFSHTQFSIGSIWNALRCNLFGLINRWMVEHQPRTIWISLSSILIRKLSTFSSLSLLIGGRCCCCCCSCYAMWLVWLTCSLSRLMLWPTKM